MLYEKGYLAYSLNHKGSKVPTPSRDQGTYLTTVWKVLLMTALVSPNFNIGCIMFLHSFSFSVMAYKEYFMIWGIVYFKAFHASFC